ncbi:hypothetical protein MTO96_010051 [Rhipicephalus appendiculatus]
MKSELAAHRPKPPEVIKKARASERRSVSPLSGSACRVAAAPHAWKKYFVLGGQSRRAGTTGSQDDWKKPVRVTCTIPSLGVGGGGLGCLTHNNPARLGPEASIGYHGRLISWSRLETSASARQCN